MRRLAAVLVIAAAASAGRAPGAHPKTLLKTRAELTPAGAGSGTLVVRCELASGWHVNSHTPSEDYLIPTTLDVTAATGAKIGEPGYPEGKKEKFSFSDTPLSVYAGSFSIEVPVSWSGAAAPEL